MRCRCCRIARTLHFKETLGAIGSVAVLVAGSLAMTRRTWSGGCTPGWGRSGTGSGLPRFRPEQWFDEIDGQLVPREGRPGGLPNRRAGIRIGSGKQRPALFSRTIARS